MGELLNWLAAIGCEEALSPMVAAGFDSLAFLSLCDGEELEMLEDSLAEVRPAKRSRVLRAARLLSAGEPAAAVPEGRGAEAMLKTLVLASAGKLAPQGEAASRAVEWYHKSVQPWEDHGAMGLWRRDSRCWQALQTAIAPVCRFRAVHVAPEAWGTLRVTREGYSDYFQACGAQLYRALVEALGAIARSNAAQSRETVELKIPGWPMDVVARRTSEEWNTYQYDCYCVWMSCQCDPWSSWGSPDDVFPCISVEGIDKRGADFAGPPRPLAPWKDPRPYLLCWYASGLTAKEGREAFSQIRLLARAGGYADCLVVDYPEVDVADEASFLKYVGDIVSGIDSDPFHRGCPLVICGHSAGGILGLAAAAVLGRRVLQVFLFSSIWSLPRDTIWEAAAQNADFDVASLRHLEASVGEAAQEWAQEALLPFVQRDLETLVNIAAYNPSPFLARTLEALVKGQIGVWKSKYLQDLLRRFRRHTAWRYFAQGVLLSGRAGSVTPIRAYYGSSDATAPEWWVSSNAGDYDFRYTYIEGAGHLDVLKFTEEFMPELLEASAGRS